MSLLQEAVIKGEDWLRAVERSSDLVVVINQDGMLLYANPAASEMFGVPLEDALGRTAFQYLHPDDLERGDGPVRRVGGITWYFEHRHGPVRFGHRRGPGP